MKKYHVLKTASYDGQTFAAGDMLDGDALRPGVLASALRTGMLTAESLTPNPEPPTPAAIDEDDTQLAVEDDDAGNSDAEDDAEVEKIEALQLDERTTAALKAAGLATVEAALAYVEEHGSLIAVKGIGAKSDEIVRAALAAKIGTGD